MINDGVQFVLRALNVLRPDADYSVGATYNSLRWLDKNTTKPTEEEFNAKVEEMRVAEPMRILREERNRRIALTDWRFRSDLSPSQEWKDYCVALRDLPANYSPTIDILTEDGYPLVKEDNTTPWPEEPSDG